MRLNLALFIPTFAVMCSADAAVSPQRAIPPASAGHALVYHDSLQGVLLVNAGLGGMATPARTARTMIWLWNGTAWSVVDSAGPPIRNLGGAAYDSKRNALVVYGGGYDQDLVYDDTWEWTPRTGWVRKNVSGPGPRDHFQMAYDEVRGRVVLFGGQFNTSTFPAETWTWDGVTWTRAATTGPSGRVHHALAYDATGSRVLMVGGSIPGTGDSGETWEWKGSAWTHIANAPPRTHATLGRAPSGVILFGGMSAEPVMRLVGNSWQSDSHMNAPSPRYLAAMAFDKRRGVTVLFGGGDPGGDRLFDETWEYSATSGWRKR